MPIRSLNVTDMWRYGLALVGPVGVAGAQFLLTLVLLHRLDDASFGRFTFLLVLAQFAWAIASALFGAPLARLYAGGDNDGRDRLLGGVFGADASFALAVGVVGMVVAYFLAEGTVGAVLFGIFIASGSLRWFGRALAYAEFRQAHVAASDLVYMMILLAGSVLAWNVSVASSTFAFGLMALAAAGALLSFGPAFLRRLFSVPSMAGVRAYAEVWRLYSGWALLGVVTTEATGNIHAYLVTAFLGPAAFAPIAASGLLIRPLTVATNAFCELERTRLARAIGDRDEHRFKRTTQFFRAVLALCWIATAGLAAVVLLLDPHMLFPTVYPVRTIAIGAALWMALAGVRMACMPEAVTLQAAGAFRRLAFVSVWSAPVSLAAVALMMGTADPIWSLSGVIIGAGASALLLFRAAHRWRNPVRHQDRPFAGPID